MVLRGRKFLCLAVALGILMAAFMWQRMPFGRSSRLPYSDSINRIRQLGIGSLENSKEPPIPTHRPQHDDEEPLGLTFFRTYVGNGVDLSNLTIPRTFFGRSEIKNVTFQNTDLSESNLCWNDFVDVDFTNAILAGADLRASNYTRVHFKQTDLRGVDMRHATFEECSFENSAMEAAVLTRKQGTALSLSTKQNAVIAWRDLDGDPPGGG